MSNKCQACLGALCGRDLQVNLGIDAIDGTDDIIGIMGTQLGDNKTHGNKTPSYTGNICSLMSS